MSIYEYEDLDNFLDSMAINLLVQDFAEILFGYFFLGNHSRDDCSFTFPLMLKFFSSATPFSLGRTFRPLKGNLINLQTE